ncbi:MAG: hypothetical protein ACHQHN_08045 [Sphingobacteriales bacterium]
MFDDYKAAVLQDYKIKKASNLLSLNLAYPTAAKLKAECLLLCEAYQRKDEQILKSFFGGQEDPAGYRSAVRKCDADKFKPLRNFLKGRTGTTDEKNIELLAWLTGFEPRPYQPGFDYQRATEIAAGGKQIKELRQDDSVIAARRRGTWKRAVMTGISILIFGVGAYLLFNHSTKPALNITNGKEKCMYWAGDHYQPVSCNQKLGDTLVYALDVIKVTHFKRITDPDTLTRKSLGRVWYLKLNNKIEFYTSPGFHPVHVEKRLKPVTGYILDKYVHHKE